MSERPSPLRVAINGFGRIGRTAFRIIAALDDMEVVAINDRSPADVLAPLVKYDSNYGRFPGEVTVDGESIVVDGKRVPVYTDELGKTPWKKHEVDVVIEATGAFRTSDEAKQHLAAGARAVVITAPGKGEDASPMFVIGGNANELANDPVISNASCTTNSLVPVMRVLSEEFGVISSLMTTVHAYTADQRLQDGSHKDPRRARAAATNIVPTSTGAATATCEVLPELKDRFDGVSLRVPVAVGSISDVTALLEEEVTVDELNQAFIDAASSPELEGILAVTNDPIVSSDIVGSPFSAIVDLGLTRVVGKLVKVFAWYDNEFGYTMRLVELVQLVGERLEQRPAETTRSPQRGTEVPIKQR